MLDNFPNYNSMDFKVPGLCLADSTGSCQEQTSVKEISAGLPKEETGRLRIG